MGKEKQVHVIHIDNIKGNGLMSKAGRRKIMGRAEGSISVLITSIHS